MTEQPKLVKPPNFGRTKSCEHCSHINHSHSDEKYIMCDLYGKIEYDNGNTETLGCSDCKLEERFQNTKITIGVFKSIF